MLAFIIPVVGPRPLLQGELLWAAAGGLTLLAILLRLIV